jgi:SNF2 family DNA or RNA helicase
MIVVQDRQQLALKLNNPERVLQVIPSSKLVKDKKNPPFVVVPHRIEEVRVLRNLGFEAPSPILHYYKWPGRFSPFAAQKDTAQFLTVNPRAFVLNDMGTGKTAASLWAYDFLREVGVANKLLVVSPLSSLDPTWANSIFNNFMHLTCAVLHGTREVRLKLLNEDVDVYIINHDGIKTAGFVDALTRRSDITHIIIDEIASFRNARTDRWEWMNIICNKQTPRAVWGLTGSPTPNEPTDAWGQCKLLNPGSVPPYYGKFRDMVMRQINTYRWVPRPESASVVANVMQPAIRYKRDECVDLPPIIFQTHRVELEPAQHKAYREMLNTLSMEADSGKILAVNEAVKADKLLQIACGVVYGDREREVILPAANRLKLVKEIIDNAAAKVIVFVPFLGALKNVYNAIAEDYCAELVYGDVNKNQRDEIFRRFQDPNDPLRVIVAQPKTMSHSLTLTEADTIIWFAPVHSNETFQQAIARISRPGQRRSQLIIMIEGTEIERRIYHRLQHRERLQGILLQMIKEK